MQRRSTGEDRQRKQDDVPWAFSSWKITISPFM